MTLDNQTDQPAIDFSELDFDTLPDDQQEAIKKWANEQLRDHSKKVEGENSQLRSQVMKTHLKEIGLDDETGLGKAIAKEYQGEYTVEAIATYAEHEYGHEYAEPGATPAEQQQQRTQQMQQQSDPMTPEPKLTPGEEAQQKMHDPAATREDAARSIASKVGQFMDQQYGPEGPNAPPEGTQQ